MNLDVATVLLQLLDRAPNYGVQLMLDCKEMTKGKVSPSQGATYTALLNMKRDGLVTSYVPETKEGGRPPTYFKLTEKGQELVQRNRELMGKLFGL